MTVAMLMQVKATSSPVPAHICSDSTHLTRYLFVEHRSQRTTLPEQDPPEQIKQHTCDR